MPDDARGEYAADAGKVRPPAASRAEIAAELADHLAESAGGSGSAGDARKRFGNVRWIAFQCWWIGHRENFMWRASLWLMLGIVTVCMIHLSYMGFMTQVTMSQQLRDVTSQLSALASEQRELLKKQNEPQDREISGLLYLGKRETPAAGALVTVRSLPSLEIVRRLLTDAEGKFNTGPLPPGDYCVLAPLVGENFPLIASSASEFPGAEEMQPLYAVQSRPLILPGNHDKLAFDVDLRAARLELAIEAAFPATLGPEGKLLLGVAVTLKPLDMAKLPWSPRRELPLVWPQRGYLHEPSGVGGRTVFSVLGMTFPWQVDYAQRTLGEPGTLCAGRYLLTATLAVLRTPTEAYQTPSGKRWLAAFPNAVGGGFGGGGEFVYVPPTPMSRRPAPVGIEITLTKNKTTRVYLRPPVAYLEALNALLAREDATKEELQALGPDQPMEIEVVEAEGVDGSP